MYLSIVQGIWLRWQYIFLYISKLFVFVGSMRVNYCLQSSEFSMLFNILRHASGVKCRKFQALCPKFVVINIKTVCTEPECHFCYMLMPEGRKRVFHCQNWSKSKPHRSLQDRHQLIFLLWLVLVDGPENVWLLHYIKTSRSHLWVVFYCRFLVSSQVLPYSHSMKCGMNKEIPTHV